MSCMEGRMLFRIFLCLLMVCVVSESEAYQVKVVYFQPLDSEDRSDLLDFDDLMKSIQETYRSEIERHGFGSKTFKLELDWASKVVVHHVKGRHNKARYATESVLDLLIPELQSKGYQDKKTIYAVVLAGVEVMGGATGYAVPRPFAGFHGNGHPEYSGYAMSVELRKSRVENILRHELGHTFGLSHLLFEQGVRYTPGAYIMNNRGNGDDLVEAEARWLSKLRHFNMEARFRNNFAPRLTTFRGAKRLENNNIEFSAAVRDPDNDGVASVYAEVDSWVIGWQFFDGDSHIEDVVFTDIPEDVLRDKSIGYYFMDVHGNWMYDFPNKSFTLPPKHEKNVLHIVPDLVAYYPFDRNSEDVSGNGNHGQIIGTTNYVEGKFGDAIALDNGVYVRMDASDSLHGDLFKADPFTLALWVYPKIETAYGHVWRSLPREGGTNTLFIIEDTGTISWRGRIDGEWSWGDLCETEPGLFEANTWVHVAVTNNGDKFRIYVNGEVVAETGFQETDGGNTTYLIGSRFTTGENFVGLIDDYAVFSKALNKDEINLIMKTSVATFLQTTQSAAIKDSGSPEDVKGDGTVKKNNTDNDTGDRSDTVSLLPMSVPSPNIDQLLKLSLKITNGKNVAGYQATVRFDNTALRYVESSSSDYLPDGAFFVPPILEGNLVKLNAASLAGESKGDGTLATLTFEVIAGQASILTLSDVLLSNSIGETFVPQIENAEITEPTKLKGDVNGDGQVNIADLVLVASNLGKTGQNTADVNSDGVVNIADLVLVAGALGTSASAPSLHLQALEMLTTTDVKQWLSAAHRLNLTDMNSQRGIRFLQQLLVALIPKETALLPNFPNPFNPETWIPYRLSEDGQVSVSIYDPNGARIRTLSLGYQSAGFYQDHGRAAYWDGRNDLGEPVASGVYFYQLTTPAFQQTRRMLILK